MLVEVEKSPDAVALYVACLWAGTAHVPLNPAFTAEERRYFIADAEPTVIVVDPSQQEGPHWLTLAGDGTGSLVSEPTTRVRGRPDRQTTRRPRGHSLHLRDDRTAERRR